MRAEFLNKYNSYFVFNKFEKPLAYLLTLRSFLDGRDIEKLQIMFYTVKSFQSPDETFMPVITVKKKMSDKSWAELGTNTAEDTFLY